MGVTDPQTRFAFGKNWAQFLDLLDEERIVTAEASLRSLVGRDSMEGLRFLDLGAGSGLSSLAACRLGATVHSVDYDRTAVACVEELRRRYRPEGADWTISQGSVLDAAFMKPLGQFDVVYSWGVLHHTGAMWIALEQAIACVRDGGLLCIAIYNNQGWKSHLWWLVKFGYTCLPSPLKPIYGYGLGYATQGLNILKYTLLLRPMDAIRPLLTYRRNRGMSVVRDMIDWIGGFPFEFASHEVLRAYGEARHLTYVRGTEAKSLGCHELVFVRPIGGQR